MKLLSLMADFMMGLVMLILIPFAIVARIGKFVHTKSPKTDWLDPLEWW